MWYASSVRVHLLDERDDQFTAVCVRVLVSSFCLFVSGLCTYVQCVVEQVECNENLIYWLETKHFMRQTNRKCMCLLVMHTYGCSLLHTTAQHNPTIRAHARILNKISQQKKECLIPFCVHFSCYFLCMFLVRLCTHVTVFFYVQLALITSHSI